MLTSIKGKGPYELHKKQFEVLMKQLRDGTEKILKQTRPDVLVYPKSGSPFLKQYIDSIRNLDPDLKIIDNAFLKKQLDGTEIEPLINTSHPDWEKFASENPKEVVKLKRSIATNIHNGVIELKKLYKPYVKFIKNFIEMRDAYELLDSVLGKKVIVIDDILSSGATMAEMVRQLEELEPSEIYGLTVFKHTTSQK
jgi:phosphoribosylpyrophosphate synthetase